MCMDYHRKIPLKSHAYYMFGFYLQRLISIPLQCRERFGLIYKIAFQIRLVSIFVRF